MHLIDCFAASSLLHTWSTHCGVFRCCCDWQGGLQLHQATYACCKPSTQQSVGGESVLLSLCSDRNCCYLQTITALFDCLVLFVFAACTRHVFHQLVIIPCGLAAGLMCVCSGSLNASCGCVCDFFLLNPTQALRSAAHSTVCTAAGLCAAYGCACGPCSVAGRRFSLCRSRFIEYCSVIDAFV
jgi:hypothetical protein